MKERWWSAPMQGDGGHTVIVTGRDNVEKQMNSGKFPFLVRVGWNYNSLPDGMPDDIDAEIMGRVNDAIEATFSKDKAAYLVAIFTGDGRRDWFFYTGNLAVFGKVFNRALEDIETLPLEIEAQSDPDWEEYLEMRDMSYIPPEDE